MPRKKRTAIGGLVYHVLNRANGRLPIFKSDPDYQDFLRIMEKAEKYVPMRVLAYCLMPNHWHLVLWPRSDGDLSTYMFWLTRTHAQRWLISRKKQGEGHLYQRRFKSFVVENDEHFLTLCRYVERNGLRAGLAERAEDWKWGSLRYRIAKCESLPSFLSDWPMPVPAGWVDTVNGPQEEKEIADLRESVMRDRPYGNPEWQEATASRLGLEITIHPRGRPRKNPY